MKVFYRPEQTARNTAAFSPSAYKPKLVVEDWLKAGMIDEHDVISFDPVTRDDIKLAHDPVFVDRVLDCVDPNGFGNVDPEVAASLPFTTGSLLAAGQYAVATNTTVCSPTSGFHHANYGFAGGYCTFNGLAVAILKMQKERAISTAAIIDLDMHYGDGTADILRRLNVQGVRHHTQGKHFHDLEDLGRNASLYFNWLERAIEDCAGVDLVIYQAGADPHIDDPLGGLLTDGQMILRDKMVFNAFRGLPLVWNLAGGYQVSPDGGIEPVLRLHRNTAKACIASA